MAAGALIGLVEPGRLTPFFGVATLYIFLPPLLFDAAWNLDARLMREHWKPIFMLAVPGVFITTALVGASLAVFGVPLTTAMLFGAIVSATDPIAIVAIFRRLNLPAPLSTIVQSESLLNDAMAVVLYRAILLSLAAGVSARSSLESAVVAVLGILGGILLGIVLAFGIGQLLRFSKGAALDIGATLAGAYAVYFLTDSLHGSGIFAVISFGFALRPIERPAQSEARQKLIERFWSNAAFLANASVFFLAGAAVQLAALAHAPIPGAIALLAIVLSRVLLGYVLIPRMLGQAASIAWSHVVSLAGARGGLSLALALALPVAFGPRSLIIDLTFTVVLATLLSSALILPRLALQGSRRQPD
ncbi:MAG: hypothetical protein NVSMB31_17300 [Vulcanimicrobiaceae bacterium]